jgi:hypothetical protein
MSILSIVTVADFDSFYSDSPASVAIYYFCDILAMLLLLALFLKGVSALNPDADKSKTTDTGTGASSKRAGQQNKSTDKTSSAGAGTTVLDRTATDGPASSAASTASPEGSKVELAPASGTTAPTDAAPAANAV